MAAYPGRACWPRSRAHSGSGRRRSAGAARKLLQGAACLTLGQRQQTQAGAVAVLRMPVLGHQLRNRLGSCRTDTLAPVDQALWRPRQVGEMGSRHVGSNGGEAALPAVAKVAGYPLPAMHGTPPLPSSRAFSTCLTSA